MIYSIRQTTRYRYASIVPFARHVLHLSPRTGPAQEVLQSTITIDPEPREREATEDFFGNLVTHVAIEAPHRSLTLASESLVRAIERAAPEPDETPDWRVAAAMALDDPDLGPRSPAHFVFPSRLIPLAPSIRDYALRSFAADRPILDGGIDLMERIKADFVYDPTATDVTTPTVMAFELRRGVCQDFAHLMIAGLRALGLPAAYVSGYLRTEPLPGHPRLEGADATHAWVSLWCGAEAGWQGLDPTNGVRTATDHIELAFGRDYADVSPVDGVIVASGRHTLSVAVDVTLHDRPSLPAI
jgi:transglutaminase-like putative cysteine protease